MAISIRNAQTAIEVGYEASSPIIRDAQTAIEIGYSATDPNINDVQTAIEIGIDLSSPVITSTCPLPEAHAGVPYSFQLVATSGNPPYTWTINSGSLPTGLSMNSSGLISGTPTESGLFSINVTVTGS